MAIAHFLAAAAVRAAGWVSPRWGAALALPAVRARRGAASDRPSADAATMWRADRSTVRIPGIDRAGRMSPSTSGVARDGEVVVLAHGWNGRASQFATLVRELVSEGYRVAAFDAPAHGDSAGRGRVHPRLGRRPSARCSSATVGSPPSSGTRSAVSARSSRPRSGSRRRPRGHRRRSRRRRPSALAVPGACWASTTGRRPSFARDSRAATSRMTRSVRAAVAGAASAPAGHAPARRARRGRPRGAVRARRRASPTPTRVLRPRDARSRSQPHPPGGSVPRRCPGLPRDPVPTTDAPPDRRSGIRRGCSRDEALRARGLSRRGAQKSVAAVSPSAARPRDVVTMPAERRSAREASPGTGVPRG